MKEIMKRNKIKIDEIPEDEHEIHGFLGQIKTEDRITMLKMFEDNVLKAALPEGDDTSSKNDKDTSKKKKS